LKVSRRNPLRPKGLRVCVTLVTLVTLRAKDFNMLKYFVSTHSYPMQK
jgi:hypothetical protein